MNTLNKLIAQLAVCLLAGCTTGPKSPALSEHPTAELVLRHRQLSERISQPLPPRGGDVNVTVKTGKPKSAFASGFESGSGINPNAGVAGFQAGVANAPYQRRAEDISEKERIERELFRRWQSGDANAELPIFKGLKP